MPTKLLILDCQKMFVQGMKAYIAQNKLDYSIHDDCCTFNRLLDLLKQDTYDVLLLELNIKDKNGVDIISALEEQNIDIKKIVLSTYCDAKFVRSAMLEGADGFISKMSTFEELFQAVEEVVDGGVYIGKDLSITPKAYAKNKTNSYVSIDDSFTLKNRLTRRESEILEKITEGKSNQEIGSELYISHQTVGVHRKNILKKLGLKSSKRLVNFVRENHLL